MKTVIPGLLTINTKLHRIPGFSLSSNLNFFPQTSTKCPYHYSVKIDNHICVPKDYDFISGYFLKKDDSWYYERNIFGLFKLKFSFNTRNKIFSFNKVFSLIPFQIGGIYPSGQLISEIIRCDMFINKILVILGMAVSHKGKNYCVIAPSYNGKTTLENKILESGGKYISDNLVIVDFEKNIAYPAAHTGKVFEREANQMVHSILTKTNIISTPVKIDKVIFMTNQMTKKINKKVRPSDFIVLNSVAFLYSLFGRSYVAEGSHTNKIIEVLKYFSDKLAQNSYINSIKHDSYEKIFKRK